MWFDEPRIQLTFEKITEKLTKINAQLATGNIRVDAFVTLSLYYVDERVLAGKIFLYLERYGYINFGVFKRLTTPLASTQLDVHPACHSTMAIHSLLAQTDKPRIIVIGAGIAGIMAARQLQYFGFETIVLEGRVSLAVVTRSKACCFC